VVSLGHATGGRSSPSNDSHQRLGRYGCTAPSCDTVLATLVATVITKIAPIEPTGCSVNAEMASPIEPSAA
jgi:hypothetical protein